MRKRMLIAIIALVIIFGGILAFNIVRKVIINRIIATYVPPPATIASAVAIKENWQPVLTSVGTLTAVNSVNVSSQVPGMVIAIRFKSGDQVQQGQPLVQLDDSTDIQDLKNNQSQLTLNEINFKRQAILYKKAAVSKSDYDQALAQFNQSQALVNRALVLINQKNVRAPFAGKIGIRQVNLGQYVNAGDALVSLQSEDPLYVDFSLPEQALSYLVVGLKVSVTIDAYPGEKFEGVITAINSLITQDTRNINVRAAIPNANHRLYPGGFANVTVYLPEQQSVITIPQTAVTYSLYGNTVYVITEEGKDKKNQPILIARQHVVTLGDMKDNKVVVLTGVSAGDVVVSAGQNKLQNGMRVVVDNSVVLKPQPVSSLQSQ